MNKLYGLIGYPVKHSMSALMHNAAFKHLGINAEYKLLEVKPGELKSFFNSFREKNISGINITIPHKAKSMYFMDDLSNEAKLIEAINTVVSKGERLIGHNTDGIGFIRSLKEDLDFDSKGKAAFIFGAGGASRGVSFSLASEGLSHIYLTDVDSAKAASLARDIEIKTGTQAIAILYNKKSIKELILNSDLLVNATPCGMKKTDPELIPDDFLHRGLVVFDLIYNQKETPLIKSAKKKGIKALNGLSMLIYQGAASFGLWTNTDAPLEVMRKALKC